MIAETDIKAFETDGAVCLKGILEPRWIDLLNKGIDRNIANPGRHFTDFTKPGTTARCIKDYWSWEHIPEYQEFFREGPTGELAGHLLRCDEVRWLEDQYFQKEAGAETPSPWHQDQPYYELQGRWIVFWMPLNRCDADDALNFVAGSHKTGKLYKAKNFSETGATYRVDESYDKLEQLPDIGEEPDDWRILKWDVAPGDILAFNPLTVHGNRGNKGAERARRMVVRYVGEDAWYDEGVFPWASMIEGHGLRKGDPFRGPKFPLVWTRKDGLAR